MNKIVFAILLVLANLQMKAQDYTDWNVSLNFSSAIYSSIIIVPSVNYSLNNSFELGLMPSYFHNKIEFSSGNTAEESSWGVNLIGKYYIYRENKMDPYASLILGYGHSTIIRTNQTDYYDNINFSVLLGNELEIGKKGWIFDFNVGFILNRLYNKNQNRFTPIYTVGFKKRFLRKE